MFLCYTGKNMLQPENRLTKVRDFNLLLKHGRWVGGSLIDLKILDLTKNKTIFPKKEDPDKFQKQLRLAFVVGLKISKSAVVRNRLKRQMREVVRLLLKKSALRSGFYGMFVAKKGVQEKEYAEISKEIELLLARAKII